jgi:hypothetical protein
MRTIGAAGPAALFEDVAADDEAKALTDRQADWHFRSGWAGWAGRRAEASRSNDRQEDRESGSRRAGRRGVGDIVSRARGSSAARAGTGTCRRDWDIQ